MALTHGVKRLWPGQARLELAQRSAGHRVAPSWRDHRGGGQHEIALAHCRVGDGKLGVAVCPNAPGPQDDIEIERPCPPMPPAPDATEMRFYLMQAKQQGRGAKRGRGQYRCICVPATRWADRRAFDDGRLREDIDVVHFERFDGLRDNRTRPADQGVRLVRTQRNQIEIGQPRYPQPAARKVAVCGRGRSPCSRDARGPGRGRRSRP